MAAGRDRAASSLGKAIAHIIKDKTDHHEERWEVEWRRRADHSNMRTGRIVMFVMTLGVLERLYRINKDNNLGNPSTCPAVVASDEEIRVGTGFELAVVFVSAIAMFANTIYSHSGFIYAGLLMIWYAFVTVIGIPPVSANCSTLADAYVKALNFECDTTKVGLLLSDLINVDCTIQGHGTTQFMMIWVLGSYFFIPTHRAMKWNWIYIILVYIPANIWWYYTAGDNAVYKPTDTGVSIALLAVCQGISSARKFFLEKSQRTKARLDFEEKRLARAMLISLRDQLPDHVIEPLLAHPGEPYAHPIPCVSILFIMICDFDEKARSTEVKALLEFLNQTFSRWDQIMLQTDVTIIETVKEEYVCAVGVMPEQEDHGVQDHHKILINLLMAAVQIMQEQTEELKVKMGVHTGEIYTGVIGQKLPRFRLFGDVINTTARMMQKSPEGMLQFGQETNRYVEHPDMKLPNSVCIKEEKGVFMKGKGNIDVYRMSLDKETPAQDHVGSRGPNAAAAGNKRKSMGSLAFALRRVGTVTNLDSVMGKDEDQSKTEALAKKHLAAGLEAGGGGKLRTSRRGSTDNGCGSRKMLTKQHSSSRHSVRGVFGFSRGDAVGSDIRTSVLRTSVLSGGGPDARRRQRRSGGGVRIQEEHDVVHIHNHQHHESDGQEMVEMTSARSQDSNSEMSGAMTNQCSSDPDSEEEETLEKLMKEVSKARVRNLALWKKVKSLWLRTGYFNDTLEQEWFMWQHQNLMCHKLRARLQRQEVATFVITAFDIALFIVYYDLEKAPFTPHALYGDNPAYRVPVFLLCRLASYLTIYWWKLQVSVEFVADRKSGSIVSTASWFPRRAWLAQWGMLLSSVLTILLFLISYDAISNSQENWVDNLVARYGAEEPEALRAAFTDKMINHRRDSSINSFMFFLVAYLVMTSHPWPFGFTCVFPLLCITIGVILNMHLWSWSGRSIVSLYYSTTSRIVIFSLICTLFTRTMYLLERDSRGRFKAIKTLEETRRRFDDILTRLMPQRILEEMSELPPGEKFPSHPYHCCTVAQSDLSGFTALASTCTPAEVVTLVSDLFGRFDTFADKRGVWKIETVGDAYIAAAAELPLTNNNKAINVVVFGQDMIRQVHEWAWANYIQVTCRVGVHHGSCIGGIASSHMRRYHLFGDLMGVVEVLESTGVLSRVQISPACKEKVEQELLHDGPMEAELEVKGFTMRTGDLLTSKGDKHSYDEVGGQTFLVDFIDVLPEEPPKRERPKTT